MFNFIDPKDPNPKKKTRKYSKDGRDTWSSYLNLPVDTDKDKPLREIIYSVAKETGIRPEVLFASAMEEGLQLQKKDGKLVFMRDDAGAYIDGYAQLGLDDFSSNAATLKEKGYLKKDLQYEPFETMNDATDPKKRRKVQSAYFNSLEDGLYAKAAFMLQGNDEVRAYAEKNKMTLSDDAVDFVTMQTYNGGSGIIPIAMEKYKKQGLLDGEKFLTNEPVGPLKDNQTYYASRKRYDPAKDMLDSGVFDDYYKPKPEEVPPTNATASVSKPLQLGGVAPIDTRTFSDNLTARSFIPQASPFRTTHQLRSTNKPIEEQDTSSWMSDQRTQKVADKVWNGAKSVTAAAQFVPIPAIKYPAMALNSAMGFTDAYHAYKSGDTEAAVKEAFYAMPLVPLKGAKIPAKFLKSAGTAGKAHNAAGASQDVFGFSKGGVTVDPNGYNPGSESRHKAAVMIPGNNITMKDVNFPILGMDNLGNTQLMTPGNDYKFPGKEVLEVPLKKAQFGGYDPSIAAGAISAMSFLGNAFENKDKVAYDEWKRNRGMSDNSAPVVAGNRGDYTTNEGFFRPDQHTPVQFGAIPVAQKGGYFDAPITELPDMETPSEMFYQHPMSSIVDMGQPSEPAEQAGSFFENVSVPGPALAPVNSKAINQNTGVDFRSQGKDIATKTNNPGNMKFHSWMSQYGGYNSGIKGTDGGTFAAFPTIDAGLKAYEQQLFGDTDGVFKSKYYKPGTSVDKALKTWSNNGYGDEIFPQVKGKKLGDLNANERSELIKRQIKRESGSMFKMLSNAGVFEAGGEYTVTPEELKYIMSNGGEVEFV